MFTTSPSVHKNDNFLTIGKFDSNLRSLNFHAYSSTALISLIGNLCLTLTTDTSVSADMIEALNSGEKNRVIHSFFV